MKLIPRSVKLATIVGMGLQITLVGLTSVHLVVPNQQTIVGLGDLGDFKIWMSLLGLVLIGSLLYHEVPGAILLGIAMVTVSTWYLEDSFPEAYVQFPDLWIDSSSYVDFSNYDWAKCAPGIAAFLFIGIIDVSGVIFGMASLAGITAADGSVPGATASFVAVSVGSIVSALTGGTPVIVYVESATGIKEGGRSGLTAVIVGMLFLLALLLAPALGSIPVTATAPVALLIGAMMMGPAKLIDWDDMSEAIPGFITLILMPFTFSITNGIVFGLVAALCFRVTTGRLFADARELLWPAPALGQPAELQGLTGQGKSSGAEALDGQRERGNSFLDNTRFERGPSLILRKRQQEALQQANAQSTAPATIVDDKASYC
jgi:AGZA family xanthine/uracil permease-like MFS transporter